MGVDLLNRSFLERKRITDNGLPRGSSQRGRDRDLDTGCAYRTNGFAVGAKRAIVSGQLLELSEC